MYVTREGAPLNAIDTHDVTAALGLVLDGITSRILCVSHEGVRGGETVSLMPRALQRTFNEP